LLQSNQGGTITDYLHDRNGNLVESITNGKSVNYDYDYLDKIQAITTVDADGNILEAMLYKYDGLGARVSKRLADGEAVKYVYDGLNILEEKSSRYVKSTAHYLTAGLDEILLRTIKKTPEYYLTDHKHSLKKVLDDKHNLTAGMEYTPAGGLLGSVSDAHPFLYCGRELDIKDHYYYRARMYHSNLGRFLSRDPIGTDGGINIYRYANNNPINFWDPLGLIPEILPPDSRDVPWGANNGPVNYYGPNAFNNQPIPGGRFDGQPVDFLDRVAPFLGVANVAYADVADDIKFAADGTLVKVPATPNATWNAANR